MVWRDKHGDPEIMVSPEVLRLTGTVDFDEIVVAPGSELDTVPGDESTEPTEGGRP